MDSRLIFLPQFVERWRDGNQNARGRLEMSVEVTKLEQCKCVLIIQGNRPTGLTGIVLEGSPRKASKL